MPPKRGTSTGRARARPAGTRNASASKAASKGKQPAARMSANKRPAAQDSESDVEAEDPERVESGSAPEQDDEEEDEDDVEDEEAKKTIPPELLTRLLHSFFQKAGTRITKDANAAVARYMDVFVREAIARAAVERQASFLEVEDLERISPQLLLDL